MYRAVCNNNNNNKLATDKMKYKPMHIWTMWRSKLCKVIMSLRLYMFVLTVCGCVCSSSLLL